jgi:arsenite oxidase small subunit
MSGRVKTLISKRRSDMQKAEENAFLKEEGMNRREILKTACCAGVVAAVALHDKAQAALPDARTYPQVKIVNINFLPAGKARTFDYPLVGRKNIIMNLGCSVEGGVGPDRSIVAYSAFCTHLGCGVELDDESGMLVCECHQSVYDPKRSGKLIEGPSPSNLPMVLLDVDSNGDVYAVGVAGLIYGLRNNLLDGEEVK